MGTADRLRARFGKTEVLHLTLLNQILDSARNVLDWNVQVDSMWVKQVYGLDFQPPERRFCDLSDVLWPTIESAPFTSVVGVGFPSELRRDYDFPAKRGERFAYQFFVDERPYTSAVSKNVIPRSTAACSKEIISCLSLGGP
jgi:hypothetical protein